MTRIARTALAAVLGFALLIPAAGAARMRKHAPLLKSDEVETIVVATPLPESALKAAWVQYGPSGELEARAVVAAAICPEVSVDLHTKLMQIRAAGDGSFLRTCWATIPPDAKQAALTFQVFKNSPPPITAGAPAIKAWAEQEYGAPEPALDAPIDVWLAWRTQVEARTKYDLIPLPLPVADPQRILVLGDTGCRIKGKELQDCSDPEAWPFARIAAEAAKLKPDLVIHVGDYLYRENACPADFKGCAGTPWGDNWPTWDADFFTPAKPLLAAAPWVIVRGNHEDCHRAGPGFLRLLGPPAYDPAAPCTDHLPLYNIPLAHMSLAVMDNVTALETSVAENAVLPLKADFAALETNTTPTWLLMHRPIWAPITGPLGIPAGGNLTMMQAVPQTGIPKPVALMLAGHIHTFQLINYEEAPHVPPQIVAGFGGDNLDPTPANLRGTVFQGESGVHVHDGLSIGGFGFLLMTHMEDGWRLDVYDSHGRIERVCWFRNDRLDCPPARR